MKLEKENVRKAWTEYTMKCRPGNPIKETIRLSSKHQDLGLSEGLDLLEWVAEQAGHDWSFIQGPGWFLVEGDNTETSDNEWFWRVGNNDEEWEGWEVSITTDDRHQAIREAIDVLVEEHLGALQ